MKNQRPVNLDISTIKLPIAAVVSILHRLSGVFLFAGVAVLLWMLAASLASEESFVTLQETLANPVSQIVIWTVLAALAFHTVTGIRHLFMDCGIGESLKGGRFGAQLALVLAIVLIVLAGVWIW